jgi:hypothetical protein
VYYTPQYIVDYIVANTVGKLLEGKTPRQAEKLRVLDPACGSGSFLIGAYQFLIDWHVQQYVAAGPQKHKKQLYQAASGEWKLTPAERKRILLNNIYGVDLDAQAVEVTKLSLCLKMLEGENSQSLAYQQSFLQERVLPDLSENVKCGNSLVGPDFYEMEAAAGLTDDELYAVNAFDWQSEFPEVMKVGGFDIVIGNPPYGIVFDENNKAYLEAKFKTFIRNNDKYVAFTQKALELVKLEGFFGYIIPNTFLLGPYFDDLKRHILANARVCQIVDFGTNLVFPKPNVFTALLFLQRQPQTAQAEHYSAPFVKVQDLLPFPQALQYQDISTAQLDTLRWTSEIAITIRPGEQIAELDHLAWVKDVGLNYWTQGRGKTRGGSIADRVLYDGPKEHVDDRPYLKGRDVIRYYLDFGNHWLRHNYQSFLNPDVDTFRFSEEFLGQDKIIYRQTADRIVATMELNKMLTDKTLHCIVLRENWREKIKLPYLLGILNSRLLTYIYRSMAQEEGRTFAQVKTFRVKKLPIRTISFSNPIDKARHDQLVQLVERMLDLNKRLPAARNPQEKTVIQRQIEATDRQIDQMVYDLYGLDKDEIAIVEEATKR